MDVWVVTNPGPNAVGCPHPRPNPQEGRNDMQLEGFDFSVFTKEEIDLWRLSPSFNDLVDTGALVVSETTSDTVPKRKATIPPNLRPDNDYDYSVAYQIAMAPDQTDDQQLAKINVFRSGEDGVEWVQEADTTYLKTRHLSMLRAAEWYLTEYVTKRTSSQNRRLRDVRRQIRAIKALL